MGRRSALEIRSRYKKGGYKKVLQDIYTIRDKEARVHRIKLNWAQKEFVKAAEKQWKEKGRVRIVVLKARQLGMSTLAQGMCLTEMFRRANNYGLVLSHEKESAKYLFGMTQRALDSWPYGKMNLVTNRIDGLVFPAPVKSTMSVATARNAGSGRSRTIQFLHASECGFYDNADELMLGMLQAVPDTGSVVILESTANGMGNWFHKQWTEAEQSISDYIPLFFPWHRHPEYRVAFLSKDARKEFADSLSSEELRLHKIGCGLEALKWRRWAIVNKCMGDVDMFRQEYPTVPEEAFLATGRPVFDPDNLRKLLQRCRETKPISKGYLRPCLEPDTTLESAS